MQCIYAVLPGNNDADYASLALLIDSFTQPFGSFVLLCHVVVDRLYPLLMTPHMCLGLYVRIEPQICEHAKNGLKPSNFWRSQDLADQPKDCPSTCSQL